MKQIHSWQELAELEPSKTHKIEVEVDEDDSDFNCYWIVPINKNDKFQDIYLSTHTFYGGEITESYNKILKRCGFDVELIGWDKYTNQ